METERCIYCGSDVPVDVVAEIPAVSEHNEWDRIAEYHTRSCEWVATRAHRADALAAFLAPTTTDPEALNQRDLQNDRP